MEKLALNFLDNKICILKGSNFILDIEKIKAGLFGVAVGDSLGVPVEFKSREYLKQNSITDMIGFGTHYQPPGTWSDDSSLTFCLAESLCNGFNLNNIGENFQKWSKDGFWTPRGKVFDVGNTVKDAIFNLQQGCKAELAGSSDINSNGNGSLMRILPLAYYLLNYRGDAFAIVHKVSAITHRHIYSQIACSIYISFAINLLRGQSKTDAYESMQNRIIKYYSNKVSKIELSKFERILSSKVYTLQEHEIHSSGYVIDTLEASLWSLFKGNSFSDVVLTAVNLGEDTDTTGAVTGGLAGIYYGFNNIPAKWINVLAKKDKILTLSCNLFKQLNKDKDDEKFKFKLILKKVLDFSSINNK